VKLMHNNRVHPAVCCKTSCQISRLPTAHNLRIVARSRRRECAYQKAREGSYKSGMMTAKSTYNNNKCVAWIRFDFSRLEDGNY
jgi:hypothetical protein